MKTDMKACSSKNTSVPFIGINKPSVCHNYRSILPYICIYSPSIFYTNKNKVFTLTDLVMVGVVIGILAALAIPNMSQVIETNRLITHGNDLLADISVARSEAIKQSKQTGICPLVAGSSPPACNTTANWGTGWIVFVDEDTSGSWTSGDKVVRAHESAAANITIIPSIITPPSTSLVPTSLLLITELGKRPTTGNTTFNVTVCSSKLNKSRVLTITTTGRPKIDEGTC